MAYSVKCKWCKTEKKNSEMFAFKVSENSKYSYTCDEVEYKLYQDYLNKLNTKKQNDKVITDNFNKLYVYIAVEILNYDLGQIIPPNLKKRLRKLNENYDFEVIKSCVESLTNYLQNYISKKEFEDEKHIVNYIMLIIEKNINDSYKLWKRKKQLEQKQQSHVIESEIMDDLITENITSNVPKNNGIMQFLDEGDY
ncbi:hypothetical protein ABNX05_10890 [Lysinibacillus sp. M3]|uniref:DUF4145 domain-containing protein n=1 Tax=Lysinibacillus zambalensis TaxID=3160866 RepID=A0ABV1MRH6_9BACI